MNVFAVLSHPIRWRIVEILASGEHLSGEISDGITRQYGVSRATVSKHLAILRDNGWLDCVPDGPERWYSLSDDVWTRIDERLGWLKYLWDGRIGTRSGNDTDPRMATTAHPYFRPVE